MMTPGARLKSAISDAELPVLDPARNRHPMSPATPPAHVLMTAGDLLRALGDRAGRELRYRPVDEHLADIVAAAVTHAAEGR